MIKFVEWGSEIGTELSEELLGRGAPGLHFFTQNRSRATREIYANSASGAASSVTSRWVGRVSAT